MTAMKHPTATVVKLKPETHARLQAIAKQEDKPMGEVVTTLLDRYEHERFWASVRESYQRLREDPVAWKDYAEGEDDLDITMVQEVSEEDRYYTREEEQEILAKALAERAANR